MISSRSFPSLMIDLSKLVGTNNTWLITRATKNRLNTICGKIQNFWTWFHVWYREKDSKREKRDGSLFLRSPSWAWSMSEVSEKTKTQSIQAMTTKISLTPSYAPLPIPLLPDFQTEKQREDVEERKRERGGVKNNPLGTRWRHFQEAKICQYRETQHKPEGGHKETGRQGKDTKDLCACYGLFAWLGERAGRQRQRQRTLAGAVKAYRYTNIT